MKQNRIMVKLNKNIRQAKDVTTKQKKKNEEGEYEGKTLDVKIYGQRQGSISLIVMTNKK